MLGLNGIVRDHRGARRRIYVLVVVGTVLFGEKIGDGTSCTCPLLSGGGAVASHYGSEGTLKLPGTVVLVGDLLRLLRALLLHQLEISRPSCCSAEVRRLMNSVARRRPADRIARRSSDASRSQVFKPRIARRSCCAWRALPSRRAGARLVAARGARGGDLRRVRRGGRVQPLLRARPRPADAAHPRAAVRDAARSGGSAWWPGRFLALLALALGLRLGRRGNCWRRCTCSSAPSPTASSIRSG